MNTNLTGRTANLVILDDVEEAHASALTRALTCWKHGKGITTVLAAELLAEGYDVQALERRHRA